MKFVQPIRDPQVIEGILDYLLHKNIRDYIFFSMGIYSGLRVDDLLNLQVHTVRNRTHITLIEGKTKKHKRFIIHPDLKPVLDEYIKDLKDSDYLFPSRQKKLKSGMKGKPISRVMAYLMLNKIGSRFGLTEIGCHSLRKTWGYHLYTQNPENLALLMEMFNHSKQSITLRYLGITQDVMDREIKQMSFTQKPLLLNSFSESGRNP